MVLAACPGQPSGARRCIVYLASMRCRLFTFAAVVVLLLAVVPLVTAGNVTDTPPQSPYTEKPPPCIVPFLRGKTLVQAKTAIKKAGCKLGVVRKRVTTKAFVGKVLAQAPARGKRLKAGALVSITLGRRAP